MTVESAILSYFEWLRSEMANVKYGRVGLVFDMADGCVTRIQKISEVSEKPALSNQIRITWVPDNTLQKERNVVE